MLVKKILEIDEYPLFVLTSLNSSQVKSSQVKSIKKLSCC